MADHDSKAPMQHSSSYGLASPPPAGAAAQQKSKYFVFIDEQNRQKRLKVIKACEGCRKRKIRCESANTNQWPCAACQRLKMKCVPPNLDGDTQDAFPFDADSYEPFAPFTPDSTAPAFTPTGQYDHRFSFQSESTAFGGDLGLVRTTSSTEVPPLGTPTGDPYGSGAMPQVPPYRSQPFQTPTSPTDSASTTRRLSSKFRQDSMTSTGWRSDMSDTDDILEQMGSLKISGIGSAPYLTNKSLAEQPAMQEDDIELPKATGSGSHVQIPAEMMPSDLQATRDFEYFFTNLHPYVPVLYPPYHLRHWEENHNAVSPLILEAIFACSAQMTGRHDEALKWLALAKRDEESFRDTPRLSTLQGMLILLKAREAHATRGYYFRSWMAVTYMVTMAKDLGLHEHHASHQNGGTCGANKWECLVRSRVWHALYVVELMIGGPQGRTEFGVADDTVDFDCSYPQLDPSEPEYHISLQYSYFMKSIKSVRATVAQYTKGAKKGLAAPALEPSYTALDSEYLQWASKLPQHLRVYYPADGSAPQVPFHFIANLNSYNQLSIIMHLRPQLSDVKSPMSEQWRQTFILTYSAAKRLCQLQESVLNQFGLPGLLCMVRGINFTIYAILTCTMLHLVALTHPYPEIHAEAGNYFSRHMRILEQCVSSWPMPSMEKEVMNLRIAFSADLSKPFELRENFPGSPMRSDEASSPAASQVTEHTSSYNPDQVDRVEEQETPYRPIHANAGHLTTNFDYPTPDSLSTIGMDAGQYQGDTQHMPYMDPNFQWNPMPIMQNFDAMMRGVPDPGTNTTPSPPQFTPRSSYIPQHVPIQPFPPQDARYPSYGQGMPSYPTSMPMVPAYSPTAAVPSYTSSAFEHPMPANMVYQQQQQPQQQRPIYPAPPAPPAQSAPPAINTMSPQAWQNLVSSVSGTKRRWNDDGSQQPKRNR